MLPAINEHGRSRVESSISVKSVFPASLFALNVVILVPVPNNTSKCNIVVSVSVILRVRYEYVTGFDWQS